MKIVHARDCVKGRVQRFHVTPSKPKDAPGSADFATRLAYARWLRQLLRGGDDSDAALLAATGLKGPWLSKWKDQRDAPNNRDMVRALMSYFEGVSTEAWLLDNEGEPPRPELWAEWIEKNGSSKPTARPMPAGRFVRRGSAEIEAEKRRGGKKTG